MPSWKLQVSSPGRICLFGEHQDYLDLDVVASAISLRFYVYGNPRTDPLFIIHLPDTGEKDQFILKDELPYLKPRDYLRSTANILMRLGCSFRQGWEVTMKSQIPIKAGTSSSSAMVVAWTKFLLEAGGYQSLASKPEAIAELAHQAEVAEFLEPGGKMDHYSSALGGLIWIQFSQGLKITRLKAPLGPFVLGDSLETKDTTGTLSSIRERVNQGLKKIAKVYPRMDLQAITESEILELSRDLPSEIRNPLRGVVLNRDLTSEGLKLFKKENFDHKEFGRLLSEHHKVLRDLLDISTPKIDKMLEAAKEAGALGGKINGSGGGGCMFSYAPDNPEAVARAIEKAGGKSYLINLDSGLRVESLDFLAV